MANDSRLPCKFILGSIAHFGRTREAVYLDHQKMYTRKEPLK
jgi:hypothetical protein